MHHALSARFRAPVATSGVALVIGVSLLACAVGSTETGTGAGAETTTQPTDPAGPEATLPSGNTTPHGADAGGTTPADSGAAKPSSSGSSGAPSSSSGSSGSSGASSSSSSSSSSGGSSSGGACSGYAAPSVAAMCSCDPAKHTCQTNGCYGGYYCALATVKCVTKPAGC
jgi:hypothetical protein